MNILEIKITKHVLEKYHGYHKMTSKKFFKDLTYTMSNLCIFHC